MWMPLVVVALACGCTRPISGVPDCFDHHDEASCRADAACAALTCPACGSAVFVACYDKDAPAPAATCPAYHCRPTCQGLSQSDCAAQGCQPVSCCGAFTCVDPGPSGACPAACVSCDGLTEAACLARSDCRADYCPTCTPGQQSFVRCASQGQPKATCPAINCPPPPPPCAQATTESACAARTDCHGVYWPGACGCAFCCCTPFSHCADGGKVNCTGPSLCDHVPFNCNEPACNGQFAVGYVNGCDEGCVKKTACQ
jgi:hypothetical protein